MTRFFQVFQQQFCLNITMNEHLTRGKLIDIMNSHKDNSRSPFTDERLQLNQRQILSDIELVVSTSASCTSAGNLFCAFCCAFCFVFYSKHLQGHLKKYIQLVSIPSHPISFHVTSAVLKNALRPDTCLVDLLINLLALCRHDVKLGVWGFASHHCNLIQVNFSTQNLIFATMQAPPSSTRADEFSTTLHILV
jgi:hypothetical protein